MGLMHTGLCLLVWDQNFGFGIRFLVWDQNFGLGSDFWFGVRFLPTKEDC
jgi:hypothetical protein